ncbi:MAG: hypothetical protein AABW73_02445 [Nanoarchaeota archaeon]
MTDSNCPREADTSLVVRYSVIGDGGINALSMKFYNHALNVPGMICDDGSYALGPSRRHAFMTIGSDDTLPEVVIVGKYESVIDLIPKYVKKKFGYDLERITDSD